MISTSADDATDRGIENDSDDDGDVQMLTFDNALDLSLADPEAEESGALVLTLNKTNENQAPNRNQVEKSPQPNGECNNAMNTANNPPSRHSYGQTEQINNPSTSTCPTSVSLPSDTIHSSKNMRESFPIFPHFPNCCKLWNQHCFYMT